MTERRWCVPHGQIEFLLPVDWGWCDYCGHVFRDLPEWVRLQGRTGDRCPFCKHDEVIRL